MISSGKKEELALIFDIGSGSVAGALVRLSQKPEIIFSSRAPITFRESFNFDTFLLGMTKALSEVAFSVESARLGAPDKVYCFLTSPWQASQTRIIKMSRKIPFTVTNKLVSEMAEKEINAFGASVASLKNLGEGSELLESEIMELKLNGYKTTNPFDRTATDLDLALFLSISPSRVLESLRFNIHKFYNRDIRFFSFPFSAFAIARDLYPSEKDFLFVDVAGELTDLTITRDDIMEESISYPLGKNSFIREIARELNKSISEATALFDIYLTSRAETKVFQEISRVLERPIQNWLVMFQESLTAIGGKGSLPRRVYLTTDPDVALFFSRVVNKEELHRYTVTHDKFNVIILESKALMPYLRVGLKAEPDSFLMLESIFINKL